MIIITVRDPDAGNMYDVFAEGQPEVGYCRPFRIIDVDLGYADLRDEEEFGEWHDGMMAEYRELKKLDTENARNAAEVLLSIINDQVESNDHQEFIARRDDATSPPAGMAPGGRS